MNMPGFIAEASLFNGDMHYQATAKATVYGGVVRPAAISDIYTRSDLFTMEFPPYCRLEYRCQIKHPVFGCLVKGWEYVCAKV
jgi:hypothetical protein